MRKEFGGCAGNIAYNLKLLGGDPLPMATVGRDFGRYGKWMDRWEIPRRHVTIVDDEFTAQAFITTDLDDNQITAFHPGAMSHAHLNRVPDGDGITLGVGAPEGREGMVQHAAQFAEAGIPLLFDPGQGLPMFDGRELLDFVDKATWVAVNDYEGRMLQERTGCSLDELGRRVRALIVTRGAEGSVIHADSREIRIPPVAPEAVTDPTGCGDAYRAGLIFGLQNGLDWETTGRVASLMGAIKVAHGGTQLHHFTRTEFEDRFLAAFGRLL